jgi:hypothetical protein
MNHRYLWRDEWDDGVHQNLASHDRRNFLNDSVVVRIGHAQYDDFGIPRGSAVIVTADTGTGLQRHLLGGSDRSLLRP